LYLEIYKERLQAVGLYEKWKEFFEATGKFAIDCYKRELEAALRSKELSGFQLLDLQDFPGQCVALVGVLNAWMESKGLISAKEWRSFCNDVVILGEIQKFVVEEEEEVLIPIKLSNSTPEVFHGKQLVYSVIVGEETITEGTLEIPKSSERVCLVGNLQFTVPKLTNPGKIQVKLCVADTEYENAYTLWAYPKKDITITEEAICFGEECVKIVKNLGEAKMRKALGEKVLCIPKQNPEDVEGTYCTDFWNYPMFRSISESLKRKVPVGTLGLYIPGKEQFKEVFPCESFTTPQWYHLVTHSHCAVLDKHEDVEPLVQPIDNIERCHKLGMLYFEQGILVCTSRIYEIASLPEVKAFAEILLKLC